MPNAPKPAARKRTPPTQRQNAQDDHEGSPHRPEEFDVMNPTRQIDRGDAARKGDMTMPAKSKAQQKAAGAALAAKRGEADKSELYGASKDMEKSMSEAELKELAETKRKALPEKKS